MSQLSKLLNSIRPFLYAYLISAVLLMIPQMFYSQEELFLWINSKHSAVSDIFFYWITYIGDGITFVVLIVGLLFYSYRHALLGLISFLSTSVIAQFLKRFIFDDQLRPIARIGEFNDIYIPENVTTLAYNSFPSGHTTTVFALATFLVLILPKRHAWIVFLLAAWITAYSRIYLTHHFPIDVWVGSLIGVLGTIGVFWWLDNRFEKKFGQKSLLNR